MSLPVDRGPWRPEKQLQTPLGVVTIRALTTIDQMVQVEQLQNLIWGYGRPGAAYPFPARCLFEFAESGGLVAGAFLDGELMAFSAAWLGREKTGRDYLHSQLLGISEEKRGTGVGFLLKCYQRDYARYLDIDLIKWTFDPMRALNANLNIKKLGVVSRLYAPNYYGQLASQFNRDLPSDRLWVEWYIDSERVKMRLAKDPSVGYKAANGTSEIPSITQTTLDADGTRRLTDYTLERDDPELSLEIPVNFSELYNRDEALARDWQSRVREIFLHYVNHLGYIVADFSVVGDSAARRATYRLSRRRLDDILEE